LTASRLDLLNAIIKRDPGNLLARYGLAMEYSQQGDHDQALETFRALMVSNADYVATYYQAGRMLQKIGELLQAREVFEQGIAACNRVGDFHARSELEAALGEISEL
jgi:cytochrome c-type biogenesis protein CcmH/NrfG